MKVILILTVFFASTHQQSGYYWREYFGEMPGDALRPISRNNDGSYSYIGQGRYRNQGLLPSTITPGVQEITVNWRGYISQSKYNKILCGHSGGDFYWVKVTAKDLNDQISGRHLVVGGHEDDRNAAINIGRIWVEGRYIIGAVTSYDVGNAILWYNEGTTSKQATSYEILIYNNVNNTRQLTRRIKKV